MRLSGRKIRWSATETGKRTASAAAVLLASVLLFALDGDPSRQRAAAQEGEASSDTTLYEVSADYLRYTTEGGERVAILEGNVRIDHQTATITSRRGIQYPDKRYAVLRDDVHARDASFEMFSDVGEYFGDGALLIATGNVRVVDRGWRITCDRARYDRNRRVAVLTGNLRLSDSTRVMYADSIVYDRKTEVADAIGNVVLIDEVEDYSIAGKHARYDKAKREAVVDVKPVLTFNLNSDERGTIVADWMQFDVESEVGVAVGGVKMLKGETRADCDSAAIYNDEGLVRLFGSPIATNDRSGMRGDRMEIYYSEDEVRQVIIPANGSLTERPAPDSPWRKDSWINGDSIAIFLSEEKVDSVRIIGNSKAMYYPIEGERGKVSNNFSLGDTMFFRFKNEELNYVRISGRSEGLYNFINLTESETIDSIAASIDSMLEYRDFSSYAEKVRYKADKIEYFADTEDIALRGNAGLVYQKKSLGADNIDFNSRMNVLEAVGDPVMEEDDQKMYGVDMGYHMDHESGVVVEGSTKYGDGYYLGEQIFKVGKDVLKVYNSTYTTCDRKHAHYSMRSNKMKVYLRDKIISGPITLYVGEIPIFYLPYMANTLRKDRHSGFLRPNFDVGIDSREGRFIRGLGYYWATNDYTDFLLTTDFNERRSLRMHLTNIYKVRYVLDGSVRLNFYRDLANYTNEWTINSMHNQSIGTTATFRSDLRFVSSDQAQSAIDKAEDIAKVVDRRIYSKATLNKRWGGTSLGISARRDQTLNVDPAAPTVARISSTLPSLSLNFPRTSLWFGDKHDEDEQGFWERFLGSVVFSPNLSATRSTVESLARYKSTLNAKSNTSFSQQHKISFLSFNPSVSLGWEYFKVLKDEIDSLYADLIPGGKDTSYKNEFSTSLSANVGTTLYGLFYPRIGPLVGIRHTLTPSVGYRYRPKLTENQVEQQSVSYSLRNVFDLKVREGDQEVAKNSVLLWSLSGGYNPKADPNKRFSNISSNISTQLGNLLSFRMSHTYDPYQKKILSQTISADLGFRLGGRFSYPATWRFEEGERIRAAATGSADRGESDMARPSDKQSWSFGMSYGIIQSGMNESRRIDSNVKISGAIDITHSWKINYNAYYNVESKEFREQRYSIDRDLHCWRASFVHRRFGNEWSYYFQIAVKAHPDIMYERGSRGLQSLAGY
jgi:lipopolysaccharide assembly outer membrane protein LptD (OstA)